MPGGFRLAIGGFSDLRRLIYRLDNVSDMEMQELLEGLGSEVESQTRLRIQEEKKTPSGVDWKDWTPEYAAQRHGNRQSHSPHPGQLRQADSHSILQLDGGLLDSIQYELDGTDAVLVGSNLIYAGVQNEERQYLGLSDQNMEDLRELVRDFVQGLIG